MSWVLSSSFGELCWLLSIVLQVLWCCHKLLSFILFSVPLPHKTFRVCRFPVSPPSQVRQKPVPWTDPWKAEMLDAHFTLLFPSQGGSPTLGYFSDIELCWLGGGAHLDEIKWLFLPISLQLNLLGVLQLLNCFLVFSNRHLGSYIVVVKLVFLWESKIWGFLFHHLADPDVQSIFG